MGAQGQDEEDEAERHPQTQDGVKIVLNLVIPRLRRVQMCP